ncbi:MAG: hypothetical protein ACHQNV_02455 [Vicinamibacteria bacterium]
MTRRDLPALVLLALLPILALAPAWWEGRLLGPGDGEALHYPLRAAVWRAYRVGEIPSWNPALFSGTPLLAAYRPGAFYPPMWALSRFPPFVAFQLLVLGSLAASGVAVFALLRRLGASVVGAYAGGLFFGLGPYLVGHLGDTATVVAAPLLPLALLAAEVHVGRSDRRGTAALACSLALLLLAGSPEASRAGLALVGGRLLVAHLLPRHGTEPRRLPTALALVGAGLLAAPQLLPTLLADRDAGRAFTGLATAGEPHLPGLTGLVLRYVSHTPAPSLALAALPLLVTETPLLVSGVALALCLVLQWGRVSLAAPGTLALVFDLTLSLLAGLSLSAQWEARLEPRGRRLRAYFLFAALASAAALAVAAATLGPLPQTVAGAVGVLALAFILYFSLATSRDPVKAGLWLLPLTVSFLLQPQGRGVWAEAPSRATLERGTPTSQAIDRALPRPGERILTLVREWPRRESADLGFANAAMTRGRVVAGGYDPMASVRGRALYDGMTTWGTLPGVFFRSDPARLEAGGVRWVQVPSSALTAAGDRFGLGDALDLQLATRETRFFPTPVVAATEVRLASSLSNAVAIAQGETVARVGVRLTTGQEIELPLRAGIDTAEWAYDRPDVRPQIAHERPPLFESFPGPGGAFEGHRYRATLRLPGRYLVDGLRFTKEGRSGVLTLSRLALFDAVPRRATPVGLAAGFVSDGGHFREAATTPWVRLFELPRSPGLGRVVERLRVVPDEVAVLSGLRDAAGAQIDLAKEALATESDAQGVVVPDGAKASRATVVERGAGRLDARAEGPGLLVVAETWEQGWSALLDGRPARLLRVEHARMGVLLPPGIHRVELSHGVRGLRIGVILAACGVGLLALARI